MTLTTTHRTPLAIRSPGLHVARVREKPTSKLWSPLDAPAQYGRYSPMVGLMMGRRNAGKTMSLSANADIMAERFRRAKVDFNIASNYQLKIASIRTPYLMDIIIEYPTWANRLWCAVDEIQTIAHARKWQNNQTIHTGTFLTLIRKRKIEIMFTTQNAVQVDKNVLWQVDLFIDVQIRWQNQHYVEVDYGCYDWWNQYGYAKRKHWPPRPEEVDWRLTMMYPTKRMFWLYNTDEVVADTYMAEHIRKNLIMQEWDDKGWQEELPVLEATEDVSSKGLDQLRHNAEEEAQMILRQEREKTTLEDLLSRMGDTFQVSHMLPYFRQVDRSITNEKALRDYLKQNGFTCKKDGNRYMAYREGTV